MVANLQAMCCPHHFPAKLTGEETQIYNVSGQRGRPAAAHRVRCAWFTWQRRLGNSHPAAALPPLGRELLLNQTWQMTPSSLPSSSSSEGLLKALKYPQLSHCSLNGPWSVYLRDVISTYCFLSCLPLQTAHLTSFHMVRIHLVELSRGLHSIQIIN